MSNLVVQYDQRQRRPAYTCCNISEKYLYIMFFYGKVSWYTDLRYTAQNYCFRSSHASSPGISCLSGSSSVLGVSRWVDCGLCCSSGWSGWVSTCGMLANKIVESILYHEGLWSRKLQTYSAIKSSKAPYPYEEYGLWRVNGSRRRWPFDVGAWDHTKEEHMRYP